MCTKWDSSLPSLFPPDLWFWSWLVWFHLLVILESAAPHFAAVVASRFWRVGLVQSYHCVRTAPMCESKWQLIAEPCLQWQTPRPHLSSPSPLFCPAMFCCLIHASLGSLDVDTQKTAGALEAIVERWQCWASYHKQLGRSIPKSKQCSDLNGGQQSSSYCSWKELKFGEMQSSWYTILIGPPAHCSLLSPDGLMSVWWPHE